MITEQQENFLLKMKNKQLERLLDGILSQEMALKEGKILKCHLLGVWYNITCFIAKKPDEIKSMQKYLCLYSKYNGRNSIYA